MIDHKATNSDAYIAATVTHTDEARSTRFARSEAAALMPFDAGYVFIASQRNAAAVAGFTPRLYRPTKSSAKRVSRSKRLELRNPTVVGRKAAMYASRTDDIEEVVDHPALDLLDRPNPHWSGTEQILLDQRFLELTGNSFWHVVTGSDGLPEQLWPMFAQHVQVVVDRDNFVVGWFYGRESAGVAAFDTSEVIQQRFPSVHCPYFGQSWVAAVVANVVHYNQTMQAQTTLMENEARPDYVIATKSPLTDKQRDLMEKRIDEKHRGTDKKRRPLFLSGADYSVIPLSFTPEDLAVIDQMKWDRDAIAAASGVPVSMLTVEDVNLANAAAGNIQYLRSTITPRLCLRADALTTRLLPMYGIDPGEMWFAYDNPVPEDEERESRIAVSLVSGGIITPNEARAEQGMEPIDGGDSLRGDYGGFGGLGGDLVTGNTEPDDTPIPPAPFDPARTTATLDILRMVNEGTLSVVAAISLLVSMVGIEDGAARAMAEAQEKVEPNDDDPQDNPPVGGEPEGDLPPDEDAGDMDGGDDGDGEKSAPAGGRGHDCAAGCDHDAAHRGVATTDKALDPFADRTAPGFVRAVRGHFRTQAGLVLRAMDESPNAAKSIGTKDIGDAVSQWFLDARMWDDQLAEASRRFIDKAVVQGAEVGVDQLRQSMGDNTLRVSVDVNAPKIREVVEANTTRYVQSVNDETERAIREAILLAPEGEPIDATKARVRNAFAGMSKGRAENIARTETARFVELGKVEQWKEVGVSAKRWMLSPDPCEVCKAVASQTNAVPVGEAFFQKGDTIGLAGGGSYAVDFSDMDGPPAHPGCRCTIQPVIEGVNE